MTVKELIKKLSKYGDNTMVCSGYYDLDNGNMYHYDLVIKESHQLGDREAEENVNLWIGCEIEN